MGEVMDEVEYLQTEAQLSMLAELVREINVEDFLRSIDEYERVGSIAPTARSERLKRKMQNSRAIALGAQAFKRSLPVTSD